MIKERKFQVHPHVLSCLLHLRLRGELDKMRQGKNSKSHGKSRDQMKEKGIFKSEIRKQWQTKNQKKKEKEMKEVQKERAEAEAEVDKEERSQIVSQVFDAAAPLIRHVANGDPEKSLCPPLLHP